MAVEPIFKTSSGKVIIYNPTDGLEEGDTQDVVSNLVPSVLVKASTLHSLANSVEETLRTVYTFQRLRRLQLLLKEIYDIM